MQVLKSGHRYLLQYLDGLGPSSEAILQFVQRKPHHTPRPGTTNQEVCRALIDRVKVLNAELPWSGNYRILTDLRDVIFMHEVRAYQRHAEKLGLPVANPMEYVMRWTEERYPNMPYEDIPVGPDGHWPIME